MDELIGKTVAQYTLQRKIGQGRFATVFEAQAAGKKPRMAVKVISGTEPENTSDTNRRFRQLADSLLQLNHPNILAVTQFGVEGDVAFLVMPLVEGEKTLRDRLRQSTLGRWRIIELLKQMASALEYAHKRDLLHLDLKPSNVLVDPQNWSWVTDFGLAEVVQGGLFDNKSAYLAPEQVLGEPVDQRSDIYALGVMMYEMLTGTLPYSAAPRTNQLTVSPRILNSDTSESLAHVTLRAAALKPADRYRSAADFLDALRIAAEDDTYREPYVEGLGDALSAPKPFPQALQSPADDILIKTPLATTQKPTAQVESRIPVIIPLPKSTTTEQQEADEETPQAGEEQISDLAIASSPMAPIDEEGVEAERTPVDLEEELLSFPPSEMPAAEVKSQTGTDESQLDDTDIPDVSESETTIASAEGPTVSPLIAPVATAAVKPVSQEQGAVFTTTSPAGKTEPDETEIPPFTRQAVRKTTPNWPVPVWVTVLGLGFVLVLIVWGIFALALSDSFSSAGATQTVSAGAVAVPTATNFPVTPSPTATLDPSSTPLPPTHTPLPPSRTATLPPTDTPPPPTETPLVSLPSPSATPTDEATLTPDVPVGQWSLISPAEGDPATTGFVQFEWEWTGERVPDQGFEIKVWRPGQPPLGAHDAVSDNQTGLVKQTDETSFSIELDITNAQGVRGVTSRYLWTVALIQVSPEYVELGEQAEPGTLEYLGFRGPEDIVDNSTEPVDNTQTFPQENPENSTEPAVDNGDNSQPDAN